jgi:FtsP/CotA-like multicopper oxidase with cupredoxin domain
LATLSALPTLLYWQLRHGNPRQGKSSLRFLLSRSSVRDFRRYSPEFVYEAAPVAPRIENGVKVFDLETSVIQWAILPNVNVAAYAFNSQVPGPRIRVRQGDHVRINVTNRLPESTTVHWHGLILSNAMDGPAKITQAPIENGQIHSYEFTVVQAGTFFYR